jgi:hypothetical protein
MAAIPLEDELGDVLDKALHCAGLNEEQLGARSGVAVDKIHNLEDYRYEDLTDDDSTRWASPRWPATSIPGPASPACRSAFTPCTCRLASVW